MSWIQRFLASDLTRTVSALSAGFTTSAERNHPTGAEGEKRFKEIIDKIKADGRGKEYDCIVGVSGGRDSTYTLYTAVKMGLRPLAVHFDNGWNSDIGVSNIKNVTDKLDVDLYTHVADWEEFKDLQISFLKASVSDAEVPTDYVILSVLYDVANRHGVRYILNGHSFRTEGVAPITWTYMDGKYVHAVHDQFGTAKLNSFPIMSLAELMINTFIKRIQVINVPEFIRMSMQSCTMSSRTSSGGPTTGGTTMNRSTQSSSSPTTFRRSSISIRGSRYSALIRSGQMDRAKALEEVQQPYPYEQEVVDYTIGKLSITNEEFEQIMANKRKSFTDYPSYYSIIKACRVPIKVACKHELTSTYLLREGRWESDGTRIPGE